MVGNTFILSKNEDDNEESALWSSSQIDAGEHLKSLPEQIITIKLKRE